MNPFLMHAAIAQARALAEARNAYGEMRRPSSPPPPAAEPVRKRSRLRALLTLVSLPREADARDLR